MKIICGGVDPMRVLSLNVNRYSIFLASVGQSGFAVLKKKEVNE